MSMGLVKLDKSTEGALLVLLVLGLVEEAEAEVEKEVFWKDASKEGDCDKLAGRLVDDG